MLRRVLSGILGLSGILAFACNDGADVAEADGELIALQSAPMSRAELDRAITQNDIRTLDALPAKLPKPFLINFTLKHGRLFEGEHGHLTETVVSQSSSPNAPRAILWDERSGFSVSWNGGKPGQTEGNRLDVFEWDEAKKEFHLVGLEFNGSGPPVYKTDAEIAEPNRKCARCHGESQRPIFSMYPDWPSFYGSDNDELTETSKPVQAREFSEYKTFRQLVVQNREPRYLPLFDADNVRAQLRNTVIYPSFPYRENTDTNIEAVSRAFAFRPSLRFGIVMNRITAQWTANRILNHRRFDEFGPFFLHGLLECRWDRSALTQSGWIEKVKAAIGRQPRLVAGGKTLHYRDLLALFDLKVNDVDIRYSYNHQGYANDDANGKVMETGYIGDYWNSYFDGSATIDELVSMQLYKALEEEAGLRGLITHPDGLVVKYERRRERFKFDENFFEEMDRKSTWIPIPYPQSTLNDVHHREGYPERFASQHRNLCARLETKLRSGSSAPTDPGSANQCPANCVPSQFCATHPNAAQAIKVDGLPCMVSGAGGCQACR